MVLVEVGATRTLSDTAGLNVIRLRNDVESRKDLAARLRAAGLAADTDREEWRTVGDFDRAPLRAADISLPDVPHETPATEAGTVDAERAVLEYLLVQFSTPGVSRVDTPFEIPGLGWPQIAIALRDLYDSTPRYVEGVMAAQADYPIVITSLTERGRREARGT